MRITRTRDMKAVIPTASMADIAFLLIVFFMVTTTITVDRTTVDLPTSLQRTEVPKDAAVIAIEADGIIHFSDGEEDSRVINAQDILPSAAFIMSKNSLKFFIIKADGEVNVLNTNYPPNENALYWIISAQNAGPAVLKPRPS